MRKSLYFISYYTRCGALPLYLIFLRDRQGNKSHCALLCTAKKLRALLRQRKGFSNPSHYGHTIYKSHENEPNEAMKAMLKQRYDFDFDQAFAQGPIPA